MPLDTDTHRSGDHDEVYFRIEWRISKHQPWSHNDQRYNEVEAKHFALRFRSNRPEREWRVRRVTEQTVY